MEKNVSSAKSGKAVLRGILFEAFLILMRYRVSFFSGVVPQLQFWHIHWLVFKVSGQSVLTSAKEVTILCHGGTAAVVWMTSTKTKLCE
jgi:hypothetical protein